MAITVLDVQNAQGHNTVLSATAFAVNPVAGDTVLVFQSIGFGNQASSTPTDSAGGNTYTLIGSRSATGATFVTEAWISTLTNGGSSFVVSAHTTSTADFSFVTWLLSGTLTYNNDFVKVGGVGDSADPLIGGPTSPAPPGQAIFFGGMNYGNSAPAASASGWNVTGSNGFTSGMATLARITAASFSPCYSEYKIATAAAQSPAWTGNALVRDWNVVAFSLSAPTPPNTGDGTETFAVSALAGTGSMPISASGGVTFGVAALSGSGTLAVTGTGNVTFGHPLLSGTGAMINAGHGGVIFRVPGLAGVGTAPVINTGPTLLPIRRMRRTPHLNETHIRQTFNKLELLAEVGEGLLEGQGVDPQAMLRWSDDGGETWSQEHWAPLGKRGEYRRRVLWRRLGQARDRVFEVVITDPIEIALITAYLDVAVGAGRR